MAISNYGNIRLSDVDPDDVEILYTYTPDRTVKVTEAPVLLSSTILEQTFDVNGVVVPGIYSLKLPKEEFKTKGIYNILLRPKQIKTTITNCGVLSAFPEIKGVILDKNDLGVTGFNFSNDSLNGFLVEYIENNNRKPNVSRIITSSRLCDPVTEAINGTSDKAIRYRYTNNGSLIFLTLTPSSVSTENANQQPFIGVPGQEIILSNTYFNPIMVEVEMVEHTIETLAHALYGNQTKSNADGKYTIYDSEKNIYKQYNLYEILDNYGKPLFEIKEEVDKIDISKNFDDIVNT